MKDQEARGVVLKRLYDIRDARQPAELSNFTDTGIASDTVARIIEQLADKGLIEWHPVTGGINSPAKYLILMARINAYGVDVIEGATKPPFAINIHTSVDKSVNVHGSQGVQIGGSGNIQNVNLALERLNNYIDSAGASTKEKADAKGLLSAAFDNPLVQKAIQWITGAGS
ncbi:hypothetical protein SAMN05444170_6936 [Bradyrhizobium erythrophlei]|uniref:Uncharacterized protein n=2 Tax=Bradyrhizobium erythrophlei TaxID=1437360 RepID=A0A1M7UVM9_9BRAD|nr:hypothetical protein SAMN05444170_6936 [Bradyrhizobium erythrophlei]